MYSTQNKILSREYVYTKSKLLLGISSIAIKTRQTWSISRAMESIFNMIVVINSTMVYVYTWYFVQKTSWYQTWIEKWFCNYKLVNCQLSLALMKWKQTKYITQTKREMNAQNHHISQGSGGLVLSVGSLFVCRDTIRITILFLPI